MKPEPLKRGIEYYTVRKSGKEVVWIKGYSELQIKSAVEWYKIYSRIAYNNPYYQEWNIYRNERNKCPRKFYLSWKTWILNKAFEDVMKGADK